jgi:hypothetical protein
MLSVLIFVALLLFSASDIGFNKHQVKLC